MYTRTFVMDGNFSAEHMKMRKKEDDAPMTSGAGFMVETSRYSRHLEVANGDIQVGRIHCHVVLTLLMNMMQRSSCHNHKAVNQANSNSKNLDATGIGATACARHGCFVPSTVVDFQKGER